MNTPDNNQPVQDTIVVDGAELTEQEQTLIAAGLDENKDAAAEELAAKEAADKAAKEQADAEAEAARQAEETAHAERAAAVVAAAASAQPAPAHVPEATAKPEAPKDFDAEFVRIDNALNELNDKYDGADLEQEEYQKQRTELQAQLRALNREEAAHAATLTVWEQTEQQRVAALEQAQARAATDWNTAATAWEAANSEFMSNPLRAKYMQDAIALVDQQAQTAGKVLPPSELLAQAGKYAMEVAGYTPPPPAANANDAIRNALGDRANQRPAPTLGDVPTAGNQPIRGNEAFAQLDGLDIEALEEAAANMTPAQQEAFLRDAPGANARGRDGDA